MSKDQILQDVFAVIEARKGSDPKESYVASLYAKGTAKIAEKVGEEAVEAVIEAVKGDQQALAAESADLLFHLMVLWADQGLKPADILAILEGRMGTSGHAEKAARQS